MRVYNPNFVSILGSLCKLFTRIPILTDSQTEILFNTSDPETSERSFTVKRRVLGGGLQLHLPTVTGTSGALTWEGYYAPYTVSANQIPYQPPCSHTCSTVTTTNYTMYILSGSRWYYQVQDDVGQTSNAVGIFSYRLSTN